MLWLGISRSCVSFHFKAAKHLSNDILRVDTDLAGTVLGIECLEYLPTVSCHSIWTTTAMDHVVRLVAIPTREWTERFWIRIVAHILYVL